MSINLKKKTAKKQSFQFRFKNYAKELLSASVFPKQTTAFWQTKIEAIANDFIIFDHKRRQNLKQIVVEARGELTVAIAGKKIKIVAIADRIEINKENKGRKRENCG